VTGPCDCRKPGLKHYLAAAERFGLDFTASIFVGDRASDIEAAALLGGTGLLLGRDASDLHQAIALTIDN